LCCLGYEHENYVALGQGLPKVGERVITPIGEARVVKLDIMKGLVTVRGDEGAYETFKAVEVKRKFAPGGNPTQDDEDSTNPVVE
jgi:cell fate regulator YaaT (PSP1 superfamily)